MISCTKEVVNYFMIQQVTQFKIMTIKETDKRGKNSGTFQSYILSALV